MQPLHGEELKQLAAAFQALGNPNRLRIFLEIMQQERRIHARGKCYLSDVVRGLSVGAPTISHHVRELARADLILTDREGKQLVCRVNPAARERLAQLLQGRPPSKARGAR